MMACARRELMRPDRTAGGARLACDDRGALVIRLERIYFRTRTGRARLPFGFERILVGRGIELGQEFPVAFDRLLDEIVRGRCEHRAPFLAVGIQEARSSPAL